MGAVLQNAKTNLKIKTRSRNYLIYMMIFMGLVAIMDQYLSTIKTTALPYILKEYSLEASSFSYLEAVFMAFTFLIFLLNGLNDIIGRKLSILISDSDHGCFRFRNSLFHTKYLSIYGILYTGNLCNCL